MIRNIGVEDKFACPGLKTGTTSLCSTVSIQNVALICTALALGPVCGPLAPPCRNAMFAVPPPSSGAWGVVDTVKTIVLVMTWPLIALRSTVFGSVRMSCVIVPAAMNFVKS